MFNSVNVFLARFIFWPATYLAVWFFSYVAVRLILVENRNGFFLSMSKLEAEILALSMSFGVLYCIMTVRLVSYLILILALLVVFFQNGLGAQRIVLMLKVRVGSKLVRCLIDLGVLTYIMWQIINLRKLLTFTYILVDFLNVEFLVRYVFGIGLGIMNYALGIERFLQETKLTKSKFTSSLITTSGIFALISYYKILPVLLNFIGIVTYSIVFIMQAEIFKG